MLFENDVSQLHVVDVVACYNYTQFQCRPQLYRSFGNVLEAKLCEQLWKNTIAPTTMAFCALAAPISSTEHELFKSFKLANAC